MRLCGLADNICFSQDVKLKVALSSLPLSIIELVFVALDKGCLRWGIPIFAIRNKLGEEGCSSNYHILMNNRANFNE